MSNTPAPINRPMTDDERTLVKQLAVATITGQTGASDKAAADWLGRLTDREGLHLTYDTRDAYLRTDAGKVIVHVTREWLAFYAANPDEPIDLDNDLSWIKEADH